MSPVLSLLLLYCVLLFDTAHSAGISFAPLANKRKDKQNCFIVKLKSSTAKLRSQNLFAAAQGSAGIMWDKIQAFYKCGMNTTQLSQMANDPTVQYVEEDQTVHTLATQTGATWGLDRVDQRNLPLDGVFNYGTAGSGAYVFVVDTGIRATHGEFAGRLVSGYDAVGGGTNDCNGHGTHVAGTAAGTTYGLAKAASIVPVRVLDCAGSGSWSGVIDGINWVASQTSMRPAVMSMSLGGGFSTAINDAIASAVAAGVVAVVAAGNENSDACSTSPASAPDAITVGSTTSTDARSSFSNWGTCVDIFAPGSSITSSWNSGDTAVNTISGTSMATPHVSGAVATYLGANPSATPAQVAAALIAASSPNRVTDVGTGSPNRLLYIDACFNCQNDGVCSNGVCICPMGYNGRYCENGPFSVSARSSVSPVPSASPRQYAPNDNCPQAVALSCGVVASGSTTLASADPISGCVTGSSSYLGVWYYIDVPASTGVLNISTAGSAYDTQLSVYRGPSCFAAGNWVCAGSNDDVDGTTTSRVSIPAPIVGRYYVVVHGFSSSVGLFNVVAVCGSAASPARFSPSRSISAFRSPASSPSPIAIGNDQCVQAISIACGGSVSGTTRGATADPISDCVAATTSSLGVWYFIDVPAGTGVMNVSTAGSAFDTQLSVYQGAACFASPNWQCVGSNDDVDGTAASRVTVSAPAGRYFIVVHGYTTNTGTFNLRAICGATPVIPSPFPMLSASNSPSPAAAPANDQCNQAIVMTCGSSTSGSTTTATADPINDCVAASSLTLGVWYYIDVPAGTGVMNVSTAGSAFDTQLSVYQGAACFSAPGWVCSGSNDDVDGTRASRVTVNTPAGRYFIAVHGFTTSTGIFNLAVSCGTGGSPRPSSSRSISPPRTISWSRLPSASLSPVPGVSNDQCGQALALTCGVAAQGSTLLATVDPITDCLAATSYALGVWYYIDVASGTAVLDLSTAGSTYDTQLSVYQGTSCFAADWLCAGNNDDAFKTLTSRLTINNPAAGRYFVVVHGYNASVGNFNLMATCGVGVRTASQSTALTTSTLPSARREVHVDHLRLTMWLGCFAVLSFLVNVGLIVMLVSRRNDALRIARDTECSSFA